VEFRISEPKEKIEIKEKTEEFLDNNSTAVKGICKNSRTSSEDKI
jgi:hypothetical protein